MMAALQTRREVIARRRAEVVITTGSARPSNRLRLISTIVTIPEAKIRDLPKNFLEVSRRTFNTMNYKKLLELGRPPGPGRLALPVAGDDARAKQVVLQLVNELGFDGVDDGGLEDSWRQQPGTPVYDRELDSAGVRYALAETRKERLPQWRATENTPGRFAQRA